MVGSAWPLARVRAVGLALLSVVNMSPGQYEMMALLGLTQDEVDAAFGF